MIEYVDGYKYQLYGDYSISTAVIPDAAINEKFIALSAVGILTIKEGYAWDGPSGPAIHTKNFMRGSLVHDALYQLMRENLISESKWRTTADRLLQSICIQSGMSRFRAWYVYQAVRLFGAPSANPSNEKPIQRA